MALPLKPSHLVAAYDFLRALPPMSGWKLPDSDQIVFTVNKHPTCLATYQFGPGVRHEITCSMHNVGHTDTLLKAIAHEQIHLFQLLRGTEGRRNVQHNREFNELSKRVCRIHGWDEKLFK